MRFEFDAFTLDTNVFELSRAGVVRPLQPKPLDLLRYLIENRDRVVLKRELLSHLWSDVRVTENALAQAVACVREALADASAPPILGVRGRGYRFVLPVTEIADEAPVSERGRLGFVAEPGMALDLDVALYAMDAARSRVTSARACATGPLASFRALLSVHAATYPTDTVNGMLLSDALACVESEHALADLVTTFMSDPSRPATVMILEGLEHADLSTLLLFCHIVEWPRGAVTLVGTCDFAALPPGGVTARLLAQHATDRSYDERARRYSESVPTSRTGVRLAAGAGMSAEPRPLTSALAR
jgi:DNA-binding winged helix-turn-helix (wHTH) protein